MTRPRLPARACRVKRRGSRPSCWRTTAIILDRARAQLLQTLAAARPDKQLPKTNVVMCRVDDRALEALDLLIEAGIRTTRSDAAAWLIEVGLAAQSDLFASVAATVAEIHRLREVA
jgi:hypothetical protein